MPTLHVLQGPDKGRTYEMPVEPAVIGRSSDQIALSDDSASRRHAELRPEGGAWILEDLHSSNGTYLNGQRLTGPTPLHHGDQIKVGGTLLVFEGHEQVERIAGAKDIRDLVDLDLGAGGLDSSILATVDASADSVILPAPETADAVTAWNVIYEVAEEVGRAESVDSLLERVADITFERLIVDHLVLLIRGNDAEALTPQVVRYRSREGAPRPKIVTSSKIINHVLDAKEGVLCANAMTDARFQVKDAQDSIHRLGLRSTICVPIVAHAKVHGVMHLDCSMSRHTYTQEQLRLAVAIGRLAGLAIENAQLLDARVRTERLAAVGETVAYLSHGIRNILQGMQSGADVVEMGIKRKNLEVVEQGWTLVRRNVDRTFNLAMNMLTFSRDREPRIATEQLNAIVEDVIALVQGRADEKSVMVLTELDPLPPVPLDPEGMHQVVHNLLLNAIDAVSAETGRVNVRTTVADAGHVLLTVGDNGPGIAADQVDHIFRAFHSTKGHGGTGLGLAVVQKIVSELGGTIQIESTEGEGTTFRVLLRRELASTDDDDTDDDDMDDDGTVDESSGT